MGFDSWQEADGMFHNLNDLIPAGAERGAGLILQCGTRYLFFLAGSRYRDETSTFYAGIGGHLEAGETWIECLQREAVEEIGTTVALFDSDRFYQITPDDHVLPAQMPHSALAPRPLALLKISVPADAVWNAGGRAHPYYVVIYRGRLETDRMPAPGDIDGLLLLPARLVLDSLDGAMTLDDLLVRGADLLEKAPTPRGMIVYPFGSARAMALLQRAGDRF